MMSERLSHIASPIGKSAAAARRPAARVGGRSGRGTARGRRHTVSTSFDSRRCAPADWPPLLVGEPPVRRIDNCRHRATGHCGDGADRRPGNTCPLHYAQGCAAWRSRSRVVQNFVCAQRARSRSAQGTLAGNHRRSCAGTCVIHGH